LCSVDIRLLKNCEGKNMSFDRLIEKIIETKNPTVVGLDPKLEYVPEFIQKIIENGGLIRSIADGIIK